MESYYDKRDKRLTFEIHEDIDECVVQKIRRRLDNEIERYMPKEVVFDFNKVSFMDSAGIGLVMGRYKLINMLGGSTKVINLTTPVRKIFEMSGILKIIPDITIKENSPDGLIIQVDGGINDVTSKVCVSLGATSLVAGSYIYKSKDVKKAIESLRA